MLSSARGAAEKVFYPNGFAINGEGVLFGFGFAQSRFSAGGEDVIQLCFDL